MHARGATPERFSPKRSKQLAWWVRSCLYPASKGRCSFTCIYAFFLPLTLKRNGVNICWPVGPEGARPPGVVSPPRREHGEGGGRGWVLAGAERGGWVLAGWCRARRSNARTDGTRIGARRASERARARRAYVQYIQAKVRLGETSCVFKLGVSKFGKLHCKLYFTKRSFASRHSLISQF